MTFNRKQILPSTTNYSPHHDHFLVKSPAETKNISKQIVSVLACFYQKHQGKPIGKPSNFPVSKTETAPPPTEPTTALWFETGLPDPSAVQDPLQPHLCGTQLRAPGDAPGLHHFVTTRHRFGIQRWIKSKLISYIMIFIINYDIRYLILWMIFIFMIDE